MGLISAGSLLLLKVKGLNCVAQLIPLKCLFSLHFVIYFPIVDVFFKCMWVCNNCTHTHTQSFFTPLQHTRTFCTVSIPSCQSPVLLVPWTSFCLFFINAVLISTSPQRAAWPFIQVWMGMTQIPDLFGALWPGPALLDCGSLATARLGWHSG